MPKITITTDDGEVVETVLGSDIGDLGRPMPQTELMATIIKALARANAMEGKETPQYKEAERIYGLYLDKKTRQQGVEAASKHIGDKSDPVRRMIISIFKSRKKQYELESLSAESNKYLRDTKHQ